MLKIPEKRRTRATFRATSLFAFVQIEPKDVMGIGGNTCASNNSLYILYK